MGYLLVATVLSVGCDADAPTAEMSDTESESVWAIDLVRTLPGGQRDYVENIERNWASARDVARSRGAIRSYVALVAPQDSLRGWDVLLMTEYTDSAAYAEREATFEAIFASAEYEHFDVGRPSSELREFYQGDVALRTIASSMGLDF